MGLFGKRKRSLEDPDFGPIVEAKGDPWSGDAFELWGQNSVQVMVNAGPEGPSEGQRSFVRALRADTGMKERLEKAVAEHANATTSSLGPLRISSIYLPRDPQQEVWRVWFDMGGEEHYSYGAEIDQTSRIVPFSED